MLTPIIDGICRAEGPRLLANLIRRVGDFELAEDAMQDAFAKALEVWPAQGLPAAPAAWLTTVARRRAVDLLRRRASGPLYTDEPPDMAAPEAAGAERDADDLSGVEDDRLRLVFTCCHPAIAQPAQMALALRTLCGLSTREIARAFLEPEATTAQRLVRAKRKILDARIPYEVPSRELLPERLQAVLGVVYLVFNEGYATTEHDGLVRTDLCSEAIRLARLLVELMPEEPEAQGLLALMLLHDARRATRIDASGALVPLEEQDRSRWQQAEIAEGVAVLEAALRRQRRGPYQLQAAIAALHAQAARAEATDWQQIALLYAGLLSEQPSPVVELNAAVALAMARGPEHGLARIDRLDREGELADYHLLPAARADLLRRLGRGAEAAASYRAALALVRNPAERLYLERRLAACETRKPD
ncbi:MAG: RNA polymerase sigma factor [Burkholderiales bacterium]|nr:RNA polymerase sigma factor [Burkholderiales bacterium]